MSKQTAPDSADPGAGAGPPSVPEAPLPPGLALGRYVILERIGSGGMGVVYAAYDPQLDRRVALKLLRADRLQASAEQRRERFLEEAKALARLSHPNVVSVHDVGTFRDQVFVAMEFVEGGTLSAWLKAAPRTWGEVLETVSLAGRGLAAAHSVGLVHHDFKPDNILVGRDGRVRVTDFGLARGSARAGTEGGRVGGTQGFMAPEQRQGLPTDARSDQYSFCVTLYAALNGELPVEADPPDAVRQVQVPGWLRRVLFRGLCADPDARFASMDELLRALQRDPARRLRRVATWLGAGVMAALLVGLVASRQPSFQCRSAGAELDAVWRARRDEVREVFLRVQPGLGEAAFQRLGKRLDAYAEEWTAQKRALCEANLRSASSAGGLPVALRRAGVCLDQRLVEVSALTDLLVEGEAQVTEKAIEAAQALPPVSDCAADQEAGWGAMAEEPRALRARLARARLERLAGHFREAREDVTWVLEQDAPRAHQSLASAALLLLGQLEEELGDYRGAAANLNAAALAAERGGQDELRAAALIQLVAVHGFRAGQVEEARQAERQAEAILDRLGAQGRLRAQLLNNLGLLLQRQGATDEALDHFVRALALRERVLGSDHFDVARSLNNVGLELLKRREFEPALDHFGRALVIQERILGGNHPDISDTLNNVGLVHYRRRDLEASAEWFRRSLRIREQVLDPHDRRVSRALKNLANVLAELDQTEEALALLERARAALVASRVPQEELVGVLDRLMHVSQLQGRFDPRLAFELASSLRASGTDLERACATARQARAELAPGEVDRAEEIGRWLEGCPPSR